MKKETPKTYLSILIPTINEATMLVNVEVAVRRTVLAVLS
jgi:hypothetical protein